MRIIYKRTLAMITCLILACVLIGALYLFYDKKMGNKSIVLVEDELSLNYLDGNKINDNGDYRFSITNNSDKDINYRVFISDLKNYSPISYTITSKDSNINIAETILEEDKEIFINSAIIKAGKTQNFVLTIQNNDKLTSFTLNIKKDNEVEEYFYATLLKNNSVRNNSLTEVGKVIATENEGLIEEIDDYGVTYYFRGKVDNNYVSFANHNWRITRINGDGSVRLVLDENLDTLTTYHKDAEMATILETDIYKSLEDWYDNDISRYSDYLANTKYCLETSKDPAFEYYNTYTRLITNVIPTFNCLGTKSTSVIGLLTADEVAYAGANFKDENTSYYLYNENITNNWWTSSLAKKNSTNFYPFIVTTKGKITSDVSGSLYRGLRPVINLNKKVVVSGKGTIDNPYTIAS